MKSSPYDACSSIPVAIASILGSKIMSCGAKPAFSVSYSGLSNSSNDNASVYFPGNSKISGTATARLRQAYATITWKDLPLGKDDKASVGLKIGQAWHPMAADHPHLFSLEVGAPFGEGIVTLPAGPE